MKIISLFLVLFLVFGIAFADELSLPFSCYPRLLQKKFYEYNLNLDLDGNDRTESSWGFLKNEGNKYTIYTYKSVTKEELESVLRIAMEVEREMSKNG